MANPPDQDLPFGTNPSLLRLQVFSIDSKETNKSHLRQNASQTA